MSQRAKSVVLLLLDVAIVSVVPFIALLLRFEGTVDYRYYSILFKWLPAIIGIRLATFYLFRLYHRIWRYASIGELIIIVGAVMVSSLIIGTIMIVADSGLPRSIHLLSMLMNIGLIGGSRLGVRIVSYLRSNQATGGTRVLVVGAGDAGAMITKEIMHRYSDKIVVGFVDDDPNKQQQMLMGMRVLGTCDDIKRIVIAQQIYEIIIAMPSISGQTLRTIVDKCKATKCVVKTVPGIYELIDGKVTVQQLRNVDLEDLLRRDPVHLDVEQIAGYLKGKRVLVTGAGGSIGSEICRQVCAMSPSALYLLGRGENSIYEINGELTTKYPHLHIEPIIADIRDKDRMISVFDKVKPQVVFHAAAHKHVPLMELQPEEAVKNNIFGTKNVAEAADRVSTEIFVMISTDKAVNPTSVMGASKRVAELIIQSMNKISHTKFTTVRFGNVLGSRGSVVPLFKKQIAQGGPITITHPDMRRYFMTIPEASQLVLQAGSMANGGELFVLDMGEPVKIVDMAKDLIQLSGLEPGRDIEIKFTGLRPGEKLFEELLTAEEGTAATKHKKIFVANLKDVDEFNLEKSLHELQQEPSTASILRILFRLIPTYHSQQAESLSELKSDKKSMSITVSLVESTM